MSIQEIPPLYESYDSSGEEVMVSDIVMTNQGLAVYMEGMWQSVDWDAPDNLKPLKGVTTWREISIPDPNVTDPIQEVVAERARQDEKWGSEVDDAKGAFDWCRIIQDYAGWARTMAGMNSPEKYRRRMVQIAAIAVAAVESYDRIMTPSDLDYTPQEDGER